MQIRNTFILLLSFILFGIVQKAHSQKVPKESPALARGTSQYKAMRYANAIKDLLRVIEKDPQNVKAQEMLASSYRNIKNYDEALRWYSELTKQQILQPEWALYYAEALANKQRYEESEQWYIKYLSLKPDDRRASAFSKANVAALSQNAGNWKVTYTNINTDASEYSPIYYKDGLLFVSNQRAKPWFIFAWDQSPFTDLYVIDHLSEITEADPNSPVAMADQSGKTNPMTAAAERGVKAYPLRGREKSNYHEGPSVILNDGSLIFTRNNYSGGIVRRSLDGVNKLKLYTATGYDWEKISGFPYNSNEYSTGHPAVSPDGRILIFASDKPGGFGGTDLYYSVRTSDEGKWGEPVNIGQRVNTEGNEMFPFLNKEGKLYFASTGHPGLGGLDLFEVVLKDMKAITTPHNLGAPVNSFGDDFGLVTGVDPNNGFFTSNRRGNDDIYKFTRLTYSVGLRGVVVDARTNQPVGGSKVVFRHNGIADSIVTNANGEFTRALLKQTDYDISGKMTSYLNGDAFVSTYGVTDDSTMNVVLKLAKVEPATPQASVLDNCESLKRQFTLQSIYYDLDRSYIRADARQALDQIADLLIKNPQVSIITSSHCDSRASEEYNRNLSLLRGHAAEAYLVGKGIHPSRIEVKYYGKSRLVNACTDGVPCPEDEQQKNRRTEFEVIIDGVNLTQLNCSR